MKDRFEELADLWFRKAQDDLLWARETLEHERYGGACFLSQQAAEKALKAYLFSQKETLLRTHNLPLLNEKCKRFDPDFGQLDPDVDTLNQYYTDTRYPDIWDYDRFDDRSLAQEAVILAQHVVESIERKLAA